VIKFLKFHHFRRQRRSRPIMSPLGSRIVAAFLGAAFALSAPAAIAQTPDQKPPDQGKPADKPNDANKEEKKKVDEIAEAAQMIPGAAGNPECVWFGRRVVELLWKDDMDAAFRHLDLYDRFGCPGPHIQASFRCVVRQGSYYQPRVHACWVNPGLPPATAAAQPPAGTPGTSSQ
jgi:hypothetical protein